MKTYLGLTKDQYERMFHYDRKNGRLVSKVTKEDVGSYTASGRIYKKRQEDKVISISIGKLCYFLVHQVTLDKSDKILYKDSDCDNLRPDNLEVVRYIPNKREEDVRELLEVDDHIFYDSETTYYIVRRGPIQAVYRTFDLKEAISIRNEWKLDKTIHKWDKSVKYDRFLPV
jgi:hypothetical protein